MTVVVLSAVVSVVSVLVVDVVSVVVVASVTVTVVLTVEVDWRYSEQKTLAPADRVGFRRARRTLSALQPIAERKRQCQRPAALFKANKFWANFKTHLLIQCVSGHH